MTDGIMTRREAAAHKRIDGKIDRTEPDWYKDAVIYQLHIKAFFDSNGDGIGDFGGLMQRLDYVESLGVDVIWILPFYPSPLRDDGYDIADYRSINPNYGTMKDFRRFVAEAHRRGIRVVTELVINHTSDQHPWFQKARKSKPGSAARDFYVWSDTDELYQGTRIIFIDTEKSNWTWDPEAQAFFWHRFYSHQPDLNFDNPKVLAEVKRLMHYWLDMGVDGLRLDAIPYLVERDGTNNENLPETHDVLKEIRAEMDAHYPDRMLLAEANQWPEDTRPYFGEGDECHMGFHFPLMPRMYMALAQEDRHPITDIIRQTPEIPESCQWAIFLRNHDELTLEMVTAEERDYLWRTYARDSRARINLGIRRRLAPLLDNDRRKIELMNALLLSMPGTPVIYYGDELGMGDNYFLGDRDGVRTPMQWSGDRNGGFSRANPQQLYLPPIMDPVYGFEAVNVEAQQNEAASLLNWMRRLIAVRKQHRAFGRGTLTILYPSNRKILAYVREFDGERILCVANLSRQAQAVELDLAAYKGAVPVELTGGAAFPPAGDLNYMLTLPAYGFFWFLLADEADAPRWHVQAPDPLPEFITLTAPGGSLKKAVEGRELGQLERDALPDFLSRQRWFTDKGATVKRVRVTPLGSIPGDQNELVLLQPDSSSDEQQTYFMPLSVLWGEANLHFGAPKLSYTLAKVRSGPNLGALIDGAFDERFHRDLLTAIRGGGEVAIDAGELRFIATDDLRKLAGDGEWRTAGVEQSNVSFIVGDEAILKVYRRLRDGEQPEIEIGRFLTEVAGYANTPAFLGSAEFAPTDGEPITLASVFAFVRNQGDAWGVTMSALHRDLEEFALMPREEGEASTSMAPELPFHHPLDLAKTLGRRTAELHAAFCTPTDHRAFRAEPIKPADINRWAKAATTEATRAIQAVSRAARTLDEADRDEAASLLRARKSIVSRIAEVRDALLGLPFDGLKTRIHGDYHLGQVLVVEDDVMIIDFEGEPRRGVAERRQKTSPLRDVAGMLRSFDYAASSAIDHVRTRTGRHDEGIRRRANAWRDQASADFLAAYWEVADSVGFLPTDQAARDAMLDLFLIQKAAYEIRYEAASRPTWIPIPIRGLLGILTREADSDGA
ncbi:maltose alpha-D-glucosyltransferase [Bauldia litoralis]|uniref:maltose alpha-D-glucosyltransferase n=1 Tax=Bauldia litoralis TaxID=665467 RepID=UPI003266224C